MGLIYFWREKNFHFKVHCRIFYHILRLNQVPLRRPSLGRLEKPLFKLSQNIVKYIVNFVVRVRFFEATLAILT